MFSTPATPAIARIVAYCARRYNELNIRLQDEQAKAYLAIINQANDSQMYSPDPELTLLAWLNQAHPPELAPAVGEVIKILQSGH